MIIRTVRETDAGQLLDIYGWYVRNTAVTFDYEVPSIEAFTGKMRRIQEKYPYLAAEEDGKILGYAYAGPFVGRNAYDWSAELTIYLAPGCRRRGIGRALYTALERALRGMGILNLYACIGDPDEEDEYLTKDSERFHAHMGFVRVGTFRKCGCKFGRWYNMIWMEKMIGEHAGKPAPVEPFGD